jgi:hypothetical protein
MGTRADFYIGKSSDAEWIGSIAWDGYRDGIDATILKATSQVEYRQAVEQFLDGRKDATRPAQGWPWPWDTSATSDCSYWFFDGHCWDANYVGEYPNGRDGYIRCDVEPDDESGEFAPDIQTAAEPIEYPNMSDKKRVTLGPRSGVIVLTAS